MNKVVLEHYPVHNLPADVQRAIGDSEYVTLTVEDEGTSASARKPLSLEELVDGVAASRRRATGPGVSIEEATQRVRRLRDEWNS